MVDRGFLHSCTGIEELDKKLCEGVVTSYLGFDATAPSLHVGSLLQIMILRHLQRSGHKPIVLLGGGTTKVAQPSTLNHQPPAVNAAIFMLSVGTTKVPHQLTTDVPRCMSLWILLIIPRSSGTCLDSSN
jgi:tyrosyl-tRNA synthetase